jgi:hypothetical protein
MRLYMLSKHMKINVRLAIAKSSGWIMNVSTPSPGMMCGMTPLI